MFPGAPSLTTVPTSGTAGIAYISNFICCVVCDHAILLLALNTNTASSSHLSGSLANATQANNAGGQPVEFNHAINYVNKIKV